MREGQPKRTPEQIAFSKRKLALDDRMLSLFNRINIVRGISAFPSPIYVSHEYAETKEEESNGQYSSTIIDANVSQEFNPNRHNSPLIEIDGVPRGPSELNKDFPTQVDTLAREFHKKGSDLSSVSEGSIAAALDRASTEEELNAIEETMNELEQSISRREQAEYREAA